MTWFADNAWITVALPFVLAVAVAISGRVLGRAVAWLAMLAPLSVLVTGVSAYLAIAGGRTPGEGSFEWISSAGMSISAGWHVDGLVALMLLVVGLVALMVMVFSVGYMAEEPGFTRYFALLCLFTGSMSALVIADGLAGLFIGWELVGACSYLLIGFWFTKPEAAAAAVKAFLTTRVGDIGLLLGLLLLWREVGALDYATLLPVAAQLAPGVATVAALLLAVGAMGKSAQFPLHIWLPDAMEGPTPVSALIHAATMVAAGVFLVSRVWPVFEASPAAQTVVLAVGAFTALAAATIALAQSDIKKVLAYSTISQLGFMFAALGAGAWIIAMFHLATHAAFKALLFLGSGSVIHGTGTQDLRKMGGLAKAMPVTAVTWVIGSLALAGVPPLAGFFSKDEVLHAVWSSQPIAGAVLFAASALTAFYITRATMLAFAGSYRGSGHPHESGPVMAVPLVVLAAVAAVAGFGGGRIAVLLGGHAEKLHLTTAAVSTGIAVVFIALGALVYKRGVFADSALESKLGPLWPVLGRAYGFDALVASVIVRPVTTFCSWLYRTVDRVVIDGAAEGTAWLANRTGDVLRRMQMGDVQWYSSLVVTGFIVLFVLSIMWQRIVGFVGVGG